MRDNGHLFACTCAECLPTGHEIAGAMAAYYLADLRALRAAEADYGENPGPMPGWLVTVRVSDASAGLGEPPYHDREYWFANQQEAEGFATAERALERSRDPGDEISCKIFMKGPEL